MKPTHIRWIRLPSPTDSAVLAFAGSELARYVRRLTGIECSVHPTMCATDAADTIWLGRCDQLALPQQNALTPDLWDDGYALWHQDGALYIAGQNTRSVLFGVYAFLEQQGVRYVRPGPDGEIVPQVDALTVPQAVIIEQPRHRHRGMCIEGAPSIAHALEMVDWCAKKRMNTIFLQFLSSQYFYNLWYERPYNPQFADQPLSKKEALAYDDQVITSMKKRGMILHRVGHSWTSAAFEMPRSGWVTADEPVQPEYKRWLAEVDGQRTLFHGIPINTELCYSHPPAFEAFVETIVQYCEIHPELDVVHVWLSDAANNKCECSECRKLSISDWYAKVINALSRALHQRVPKMRFVFLCYIELLWPPEQVALSEEADGNAIMMYAPIARCYGHPLADPDCDDGKDWPRPPLNEYSASRFNAFYVQRLTEWRQVFAGDSFDFDYHLMWANWNDMTDTHIAQVLYQDLQDLRRLGLDGNVSCQSFRVFYPTGLAVNALAEGLWNPEEPWTAWRGRYLETAYGEHAAWVDEYLATLETFLAPPDPHWKTPPLQDADQAKLDAFATFLEQSLAELTTRQARAGRVRALSLDLLAHHAVLLGHVVAAYAARLAGNEQKAETEFDRAAQFLQDTEPQYSTYIDTMLALRVIHRAKAQGE